MANDQESFANRSPGHFDLLQNWYADNDKLIKRKGVAKFPGTHATGARTYGAYGIRGYTGADFLYAKVTSDDLYFWDNITAAWNVFTGHAFPTSETYFAELNGFMEWNTWYDVDETVKAGSTATDVLLGNSTGPWTDNLLAGKVARFNFSATRVEYKVIAGNYNDGTDDHLLFNEDDPLNGAPAIGTTIDIHDANTNLYIGGGGEYARVQPDEMADGVVAGASADGYRQLDTTNTAIIGDGFTGITSHANRIFGWYQDTVRFSDLYNGDNFGSASYIKFSTLIRAVVPFNDNVAIIYGVHGIWALIGVSPSSWELRLITQEIGCNDPKTIATYSSTAMTMQFFVARDGSVRVITSDSFRAVSREVKLESVSENYIHKEFSNLSNWTCGGIDNEGRYHVFRGSTGEFWTLNVRASEKMRFREWAWSKGQFASASLAPYITANIAGSLRLGMTSSGQLYTMNNGTTDDGTAIPGTIRRRGLNFDALGDRTKFSKIQIAQGASDSSTTMTVKAEANNSTAGTIEHTIMTYDPSTGDKLRKGTIPNNPSLQEGTGQMIDYEITESGSVAIAPIEQINFGYRPSVLL